MTLCTIHVIIAAMKTLEPPTPEAPAPPIPIQAKLVTDSRWSILAGARFLLASWVVMGHYFLYHKDSDVLSQFSGITPVLGFFIISGYSIAHSITEKPVGFASRRVRRIAPLYYASILFAFIPIIFYGMAFQVQGSRLVEFPDLLPFLASLVFLQGWISLTPKLYIPMWSLACEVFYYCLAPIFQKLSVWVLSAVMLASFAGYALYQSSQPPVLQPIIGGATPLAMGWAWLLGFMLYKSPRSLLLRLFVLFTYLYTGIWLCLVCTVVSIAPDIPLKPWLGKVLWLGGELSYPMYCVQWTVLCLLGAARFLPHDGPGIVILAYLAVLSVAAIFYYGVDAPSRRTTRKLAWRS